jgi:hypothetical protein
VQKQETRSTLSSSPACSTMIEPLNATKFEPLKREEKRLTPNFERESPGETQTFSLGKTPERRELAKQKSQYYDDAFAVRESKTSARERFHRESMVMVEVRTNVIVRPQAYPSVFWLMESRLAMSIPSSPTSRTTFQAAINGQNPLSL